MEITLEDALVIREAISQELLRIGRPDIHHYVAILVESAESTQDNRTAGYHLSLYISTLISQIESRSHESLHKALTDLREQVTDVEDANVIMSRTRFADQPESTVPLRELITDYSAISTGLRSLLEDLELEFVPPKISDSDQAK